MKPSLISYGTKKNMHLIFFEGIGKSIVIIGSNVIETRSHFKQLTVDLN
jgi:hypothetical protein